VTPILSLQKASVVYDSVTALDAVDLTVCEGETVVLLGEAGSGKTTLLKSSVGLIRLSSGQVKLFDEDITKLPEEDLYPLRSRTGMLFQEGGLFDSLNIEANVGYPLANQRRERPTAEDIQQRVLEALRFVELEQTTAKFPSELSGGMRRRVGIARANVTNPRLIFYDSPTAGLDPITANTIMALIIRQRDQRGTTTVLTTHRYQDGSLVSNFRWNAERNELERASPGREFASLGARFVVMRHGRIVFSGTQAELERSRDAYVSKFVMHPEAATR
jgi:phospholipid/cholesterol/gamma-HCH transport system ATP-binding protein